jgi:hypothetical protein
VIAQAFCVIEITRDNMLRLAQKRLIVPFAFLLMNPAMRYSMNSVLVMRGGRDCGVTQFSMENMDLAYIPDRQLWTVFFQMRHAAIVYDERCIVLMEDVMYAGYNGGETPHPIPVLGNGQKLNFRPERWGGDMIYALIGYATRARDIPHPNSVLGYFPPTIFSGRWYRASEQAMLNRRRWTYGAALYYQALYGLDRVMGVAGVDMGGLTPHRSDVLQHNILTFQDTQYNNSPDTHLLGVRVPGRGYHGDYVYPGVGSVRKGAIEALVDGGKPGFVADA